MTPLLKKSTLAFTLFLISVSVLGILGLVYPGQQTLSALVLASTTIVFLAGGLIPEYLVALVFFILAIFSKAAPADIIFSGFQSKAFWLVFTGLVIGAAVKKSGLGRRLASTLGGRLAGSYFRLLAGMAATGLSLSFIMPSAMGRVLLLVPIALALAEHFGFKQNSNGRKGMILSVILGTYLPAFTILPANMPNMVLAGMAEHQLGIHLFYFDYLVQTLPVLGLVKTIVMVMVVARIYPDTIKNVRDARPPVLQDAMARSEVVCAIILSCLILLWMTDVFHHIPPAWVGLAGAVLLLFPGIGPLDNKDFLTLNFASLFFVAGIIGMGNLIRYSGLSDLFGHYLISALPLGKNASFANYLSITLATGVTGLFATQPGVPAVITPLCTEIAKTTGLPTTTVLMSQVAGFSLIALPYQAPPLLVAMQMAKEEVAGMVKPLLVIVLISCVCLVPLNYLWWRILGII